MDKQMAPDVLRNIKLKRAEEKLVDFAQFAL